MPWLLWIEMDQASLRGTCVRLATVRPPSSTVHSSGYTTRVSHPAAPASGSTWKATRGTRGGMSFGCIVTRLRRSSTAGASKPVTTPREPLTSFACWSRFLRSITCAPKRSERRGCAMQSLIRFGAPSS